MTVIKSQTAHNSNSNQHFNHGLCTNASGCPHERDRDASRSWLCARCWVRSGQRCGLRDPSTGQRNCKDRPGNQRTGGHLRPHCAPQPVFCLLVAEPLPALRANVAVHSAPGLPPAALPPSAAFLRPACWRLPGRLVVYVCAVCTPGCRHRAQAS